MKIKTKAGDEIDITDWVEDIKSNLRCNLDPFERTPVGKMAGKGHFWWDAITCPDLDKRSLNKLVKTLRASL